MEVLLELLLAELLAIAVRVALAHLLLWIRASSNCPVPLALPRAA